MCLKAPPDEKITSAVGKPRSHPFPVTEAGFGPGRMCAPVLEAFQQLRSCPDLPLREPQTGFVPGHRQQMPQAEATGPSEPGGDTADVRTAFGRGLLAPSVLPKVGPILETCQSPVSLGLTLPWVLFKIPSTPLQPTHHLSGPSVNLSL